MQQLNENIKNNYKQRIVEGLLNEGPPKRILKPLNAAERALRFGLRMVGKPQVLNFAGRSWNIIRGSNGAIEKIYVQGRGWITIQEFWDQYVLNLTVGAVRDKTPFDPAWFHEVGKSASRIERNLYKIPENLHRYLPGLLPGVFELNPDTVDAAPENEDGSVEGYDFDPTNAPHMA